MTSTDDNKTEFRSTDNLGGGKCPYMEASMSSPESLLDLLDRGRASVQLYGPLFVADRMYICWIF